VSAGAPSLAWLATMSTLLASVASALHLDEKELVAFYADYEPFVQAGATAVTLITWYVAFKRYLGGNVSPKKAAWILSFFASCFSAPFGFLFGPRIFDKAWDPAIMLEADDLNNFLVIFFMTYLIFDTLFGVLEYGEGFGFLSGWVHHLFYIGFLLHSYVRGYTISFGYTLPMELSSILLSGGRFFPLLRRDLLFGALFFVFRIVYHGYLLWEIYCIPNPRVVIWPPVLGVFFLHWYWFYGWVRSLQRRKGGQYDDTPRDKTD
jgi:hypothetical protein